MMSSIVRTGYWMSARSLGGVLALWGILNGSMPGRAVAETSLDAVATSREPWQQHKVKRGISVERRPVKGSSFFEYRASIGIPMAPALLIEDMWRTVTLKPGPLVKKRQILKQNDTEIVFYDQIQTPVVSDRDYTMRLRKVALGNDRFQMVFETANELGPGPDPKHVRILAIHGAWSLEPDPSVAGGSLVTYQSYSEPGGSVPAFMIHGAQVDQTIKSVETLKARILAAQNPPSSSK